MTTILDTSFDQSNPSLAVPTDESLRHKDDWDEQSANVQAYRVLHHQVRRVSARPMPFRTIRNYATLAARRVDVETLDDGRLYGTISGFSGVWAVGASPDELVTDLEETVYGWVLLKIEDEDRDLPVVHGIDLNQL